MGRRGRMPCVGPMTRPRPQPMDTRRSLTAAHQEELLPVYVDEAVLGGGDQRWHILCRPRRARFMDGGGTV